MDSLECFTLDLLMHLEAFLNKVDIFSPCFVCWCLKARKLDRLNRIFAIFENLNSYFSVDIVRCAGASSGAVVACAAVAGVDSSWLRSVFQDLVSVCGQNKYGPWSRNFNVEVILKVNYLVLKVKLWYFCCRMCSRIYLQTFT